MRLICPNCGAQYAVDERMIPRAGRDVQCSGCGYTWFQVHPDADPDLMDELAETPAPTEAGPAREREREREPATAEAEMAIPGSRRGPDQRVLNVLREEAERERAAREAERAAREAEREALEVQGDLDLVEPEDDDGSEDWTDPALEEADARRAARAAPRRTLLPDIEEINSTLEPTSHGQRPRPETAAQRVERQRRAAGRRIGFAASVAAFLAATLVYLQGPRIGEAVPAIAPSLNAYVAAVDSGRLWLDGALRRAAGAAAPRTETDTASAEG